MWRKILVGLSVECSTFVRTAINASLLPSWEKGGTHRGRFFGKPLRTISRCRHQDAQIPLLPVWEKGAGGMRGKGAREWRTSLISPKNSTLECRCKPDGSNAAGSAHLRRAEALAEVGQALRAGSTQVPLAHGQDNRHASPAGASMRSGRASARCAPAPQGLPCAQGGLQPAAPQPRRDFHALREGLWSLNK